MPRKDTITVQSFQPAAANTRWKPVICGKNYGKREMVWVCISYGGKSAATHKALSDVLGDEIAMDYGKRNGTLSLRAFHGTAKLEAVSEGAADLSAEFGKAGEKIANIFDCFLGAPVVSTVVGTALAISSAMDKLEKSDVLHGAHAEITAYWARMDIEHPEDDDVNMALAFAQAAPSTILDLPGEKEMDVDVGNNCFLYMDYATWVQQTGEGYLDWWGEKPPKCFAKTTLTETEDFAIHYKLHER